MRKRIRMWVWYSAIWLSATVAEVSRTSKPSMPRSVLPASSSALFAASRHDEVDTPTRSIVLITAMGTPEHGVACRASLARGLRPRDLHAAKRHGPEGAVPWCELRVRRLSVRDYRPPSGRSAAR